MRTLVGRPATAYWRLEDGDGNPIDATVTPTVAVTRDRDATAVAPITVGHVTTGQYSIAIPPQPAPELLTASVTATAGPPLSGTVTDAVHISVVGSRLVNLARLRQDNELATLASDTLREALEAAEDECRDNLGYPPTPVMERVFVDAGGRGLMAPNPYPRYIVAAIRPNGIALTSAELALIALGEGGGLIWTDMRNWDAGAWTVWMVHGRWDTPPMDLSRAVMIRTRYMARRLANKDDMPERATSVATEGGTITFAFPTLPRPTGIPEVDIVYMRYAMASELPVK